MCDFGQLSTERGYSLLELLIVCVLFAILTHSALSGFPELMRSVNRNTARQQLEFDFKRARAEALSHGARGVLTVNASGTGYSLGIDYAPFDGTNDVDVFTRELPTGVLLTLSTPLIFSSSGYTIDTAGALTSVTVTLGDDEGTILSGTLYPVGSLDYE